MSIGRWAVVSSLVVIGTILPIRSSAEGGLEVSEAACEDGTCCPELKSDCIINNILTQNSYAKLTGSRCKAIDVPPAAG